MKDFYDLLSKHPDVLKNKIKEADTMGRKIYYSAALVLHAGLVVVLAVLLVTILTMFFGEENSALAVVILVMLLTIRFVNFGYCIGDTLVNLAVLFAVLVFGSYLSTVVPSGLIIVVHLVSMFLILCIATQQPRMGLGGMFAFAYIYMVGNPVSGEMLTKRAEMAVVGFLICAVIMIYEHRKKSTDIRFFHYLKEYNSKNMVLLWQIRLTVGVSLTLTIGALLDMPRFMWMGFACAAMLNQFPCTPEMRPKFYQRIEGAALGSVFFLILCQFIPIETLSLVGLISGFFLGFCAEYRNKTLIICFGALSVAAPIYGVANASLIRIANNVLGALLGMAIAVVFDRLIVRHLAPPEETSEANNWS